MRVSPISVNYQIPKYTANKLRNEKPTEVADNVQFKGKHDCAKLLGSTFGALGTLGAMGGIAIMTGGISLIPTLIYGATCATGGVLLGNELDKVPDDDDKKKNK